ncbi:conjugal transfer protein (plasmid) [Streptomyces sp. QHH-9511]|uniref:conjugal transfer protein n=1 Tax=Streptomyces sp. QHH-9511 TaxID=2684468 RepID=UPI0013197304|nr:conjugal transfer protein [Streptomyces sp. QHH-9511]QGZ53346.1 conjugal transfer protein [Streptomyces sp. QHH-9511]
MNTDHTSEQRQLTRGQIVAFTAATIPMIAVGVGGGIGTYANAKAQLGSGQTALGMLAAGEGATLIAAIVMIAVTMLGQAAPRTARAALWLFPIAASVMGLVIAPAFREAVIYALTPLAMTAAAEGASFVARRIVTYTTRTDMEAQRRNSELMRRIAFHQAQAQRHPWKWVRNRSELTAWRLMRKVGSGDAQLGSGLINVQRTRLTDGADSALLLMLTGSREPITTHPEPRALTTGEPTRETEPSTVSLGGHTTHDSEPTTPHLADPRPALHTSDQRISREPVLIPSEPTLTKAPTLAPETTPSETDEPDLTGVDEKERQITVLAHRLRSGESLTKTTAAQLLGVSPATAGRRLKDARDRITEGTGLYL